MRPMVNEKPITRNINVTSAVVRVGDNTEPQSIEIVGRLDEKHVSAKLRREFARDDIWCESVTHSVRHYSMDIYDFIESEKVTYTEEED